MINLDATNIIDYDQITFLEAIDDLVKQIKSVNWKPDYIVGIVRGGAVPAVYLSHKLKIPVQMIHWSSRDDLNCGNESNCFIPEDINCGKRILLVDDIVDGGDTIREILADWDSSIRQALVVENIRIAALVYNTAQDTKVDFFHTKVDRNEDNRWFVFPWEA